MKRLLLFTPLVAVAFVPGCSVIDKLTGSGSTCSGAAVYGAGTTTTGATGTKECKGPNGVAGQLYAMTLDQEANMQLTVTATGFQPFLGLYTAAGKVISENNTHGKLNAFLPAGSYQVIVAKASGSDGNFTLSSPPFSLGGCASSTGSLSDIDMGATVRGAAFNGIVTVADCGASNAKTHVYMLHLAAGDTLTSSITVDRPAGLYLIGATGAAIVDKEMANAGTWSNTYVVLADGLYSFHVESRTTNGSSNLPLAYSVVLK